MEIFVLVAMFIGIVAAIMQTSKDMGESVAKRLEKKRLNKERLLEEDKERRRQHHESRTAELERLEKEAREAIKETEKKALHEASEKMAAMRTEHYLDYISPIELEKVCLLVFKKLGYEVQGTSTTGDNGVDGFLRKDGKLTILQCKRYRGTVGEPVLRDLRGAMEHFGASEAIIATTGKLTEAAQNWIKRHPIRVIYKPELANLIKFHIGEEDVIPDWFRSYSSPKLSQITREKEKHRNTCPKCYASLVTRHGPHGKFWGCSRYPRCDFTKNSG